MSEIRSNQGKVRNLGIIAAMYLFGIFMGAIDTGIVTPARTIIQNNLQVDEKLGIWMITIYTLAYAASIPIMGKLADRYGRKYIYLTAITLFGVGSLFCGLAQDFNSFTLLLAARVVQAIGGGGIIPVATAEFGTTFPPEKRGMALGLIGGVYGIANIFGASAGSAILDLFGKSNWQFIFYLNLPICLFVIICGFIFLPNTRLENTKKIDIAGIFLISSMVLSLLYGLKNIDFFDFRNTLLGTDVYPFLLIFLILLPFFILAEKKAGDPVMNLGFFTNGRIIVTLIVSFITGIAMMGMIFVPQFSENAMKLATGSGGYYVMILGFFAGGGAPLSGKLIDKFSPKAVLLFGFGLTFAGALFAAFVTIVSPSFTTVFICLMLIGLGMGFTIGAPLNYMMLDNTRKEESNSALATLSLVRSIGTTIAPAIMIGFLAHAGATIQDKELGLLPKEVNVPVLPYARELTDRLNELKADPNMKDKLSGVSMPDLASMTKVEIDMKGDGSYKLPEDLVELMKSADVTNITRRIRVLAARMFGEMTPEIVADIQSGVATGIDGIQSGIEKLDKNINDLQSGADGAAEGIAGMEKAVAGLDTGISSINKALYQQKAALAQLSKFYSQIGAMMTRAGGADSTAAAQGQSIPAGGSMAQGIVDMIPPQVKAAIPQNVLDQLKDVKTVEDLEAKIQELKKAIGELSDQLPEMEKQRSQMLDKISDTRNSAAEMKKAIEGMKTAKTEMLDTINKMKTLKEAVPQAFEKARDNYLTEINKLAPQLENRFQSVLNTGFRQIYMTVAVTSAAAMLFLIFYRRKKLPIDS